MGLVVLGFSRFGSRNELHPWIQKAKLCPPPDPAKHFPFQENLEN